MLALVLVLSFSLVVAVPVGAEVGSALEVSQPVQVTSDSHYERGQSIVYDGTNYWLFYGRSATCTGNYQNDNPDVSDYALYYKKADTIAGLANAEAAAISGEPNSYLGETGAAYVDGKVWTFTTVPSITYSDRMSLYGWYTTDGGTSWTQVADLADNLPPGAAHHDEIGFDGKLYVMANYPDGESGWHTKSTDDPTASSITWSSYVNLGVGLNGLGHFFVDETGLYIGILRTNDGSLASTDNFILQYNSSEGSWTQLASVSSTGWDPTLFKVGSNYVFAQAPSDGEGGGRQYIVAWTGTTLSDVLDGSSKMVSAAKYGDNTWGDMWPIGFTDATGDSYLFFISERDEPTQEGTGNIWYIKVDWDTSNDHFTYIQPAIDSASSGDTINVAAGTYNERITINKSLILEGANAGIPIEGRGSESIINAQGLEFGVLIDGTDTIATFDGFTVENYERAGILAGAFSLENDPAVVHILNNIVTEPISQQNNNCIQVGDGTTGTIIGNEVMGAFLESPDWTGSGILVAGSSNVVVSGNYAHDCESGICIAGYAVYREAPAVNNLVENNSVENSGCGISVQMNSIGTIISDNDVLNNTDVGIESVGGISWELTVPSGTEIHYNNIVGNANYGVKSSVWESGVPEQVSAESNWWGAASGPYHATANPNGTGDVVSDNVNFEPWLTAEGGAAVAMTAETPQIVAISVDPTSINFGTLYPGDASAQITLAISNIGTVDADVSTLILDAAGDPAVTDDFFYDNLRLFNPTAPATAAHLYATSPLLVGGAAATPLAQVIVPPNYAAVGTVTGTLVFVAAPTPTP